MSRPCVCIVVPTYNEVNTIRSLLEEIGRVLRCFQARVIIVDDGSMDGTREAIRFSDAGHDIQVIERHRKMGLGSAIIEGFKVAVATCGGGVIVTMDADLSHDPKDIPRLVSMCDDGVIAIGSRYVRGGSFSGSGRRILSAITNKIVRWATGIAAMDCTSGFRCYSNEVVKRILPELRSEGYEIQIETLLKSLKAGYSYVEVPVAFQRRQRGISKLGLREVLLYFPALLDLAVYSFADR